LILEQWILEMANEMEDLDLGAKIEDLGEMIITTF